MDTQTQKLMFSSKSNEWETPEDFYKNLKFMTFKIKQRAHKDYDRYKGRQIEKAVEATMREGVPPEDQNKIILIRYSVCD